MCSGVTPHGAACFVNQFSGRAAVAPQLHDRAGKLPGLLGEQEISFVFIGNPSAAIREATTGTRRPRLPDLDARSRAGAQRNGRREGSVQIGLHRRHAAVTMTS